MEEFIIIYETFYGIKRTVVEAYTAEGAIKKLIKPYIENGIDITIIEVN